jgi:hypothetical protein
LIYGSEVI